MKPLIQYVNFREVVPADAEFLVECREGNGHRTRVTVEGTREWIAKDDPNRTLKIFEYKGDRVGVVRADLRADGKQELAYNIHPDSRGQGYGSYMVCNFALQLWNYPLRAIVRQGNFASEMIARRLGLIPVPSPEPGFDYFESPAIFVDAP